MVGSVDNLAAALHLAESGFSVFPCRPFDEKGPNGSRFNAKTPRVKSWRQDSTTNSVVVRDWWTQNPDSIAAIDLSKVGLFVVDLDMHEKDRDGISAFRTIARTHDDRLDDMPVVETAGNGFHLYYRQPSDHTFGNAEGALAGKGINIRGSGGYVIGPGMARLDGTGWYCTHTMPDLVSAYVNGTIPTVPNWLQAEIGHRQTSANHERPAGANRPPVTKREITYAREALSKTVDALSCMGHGRNSALFKSAATMGSMIAAGWIDERPVIEALHDASTRNGYRGKDGDRQVAATIDSGMNSGKAEPRAPLADSDPPPVTIDGLLPNGLPEKLATQLRMAEPPRPLRREMPAPQQFPIEALGDLLAGAANAIVGKIMCPPAVAAMSVLGAASLAIQAHADVRHPSTQHARPTSLFLLTIAASGERKSAADTEAQWAVREFEKEQRAVYDSAYAEYVNRMEAWQSTRDQINREKKLSVDAKTDALRNLGVAPSRPLRPILTCPEPTFEGLCRLYIDGFPMLGIFNDEGGQFIGGHGLSKEHRLATITGLSAAWDGTPIKRVRVTDGISILPGRRLAMHLMVQPDAASLLLADPMAKDQGFLSRLLVAAPASTAGTRFQNRAWHSAERLNRYHQTLLTILRTRPPLAQGKENELEPRQIELDEPSSGIWRQFADDVERRLAPGGPFEPIRGFANKLPEHALRLAGVLTLVEDLRAPLISETTLKRAIVLAEYFASEALRLFDAGMTSPDIRLAESLRHWLHTAWAEEHIGLKVIYQRGPNAIRDKATARRIVAILDDHGWLEPAQNPAIRVNGAPVKEAWKIVREVAPTVATSATSLPGRSG